jgi:hypothetical protein
VPDARQRTCRGSEPPVPNRTGPPGRPPQHPGKAAPRTIAHPGRSSRPRNPDAHSPGSRGPQTNVPPSGEKRAATMVREPRTARHAPAQFAHFVKADPGNLPQTPRCQVRPEPVDQPLITPSRSRSPNFVAGAVPDQTRTYLSFTLPHCAVRAVDAFLRVCSGPMWPISATWNRHTLALADAGRLRLPETVRTWLASR